MYTRYGTEWKQQTTKNNQNSLWIAPRRSDGLNPSGRIARAEATDLLGVRTELWRPDGLVRQRGSREDPDDQYHKNYLFT